MSYDVSIGDYDGNYTWNSASPLFHEHIDGGIDAIDGMTGRQASNVMRQFWISVNRERHDLYEDGAVGEPQMCAKYDSPNGWGSLVGALMFAGQITAACAQYPRHKVRVY